MSSLLEISQKFVDVERMDRWPDKAAGPGPQPAEIGIDEVSIRERLIHKLIGLGMSADEMVAEAAKLAAWIKDGS